MLTISLKRMLARWLWWSGLLLAVLWVNQPQAAPVNGMYDAAVRITETTEASRQAAFSAALGIVAARVTGQRDAATKLGPILNTASKYVQRYGYNSGFLEVGFDSAGVNSMLEQAGLPLWGRDRPLTLVVMPAALQGVREARAAVEQTAKLRGIPLIWARTEVSDHLNATSVPQAQALADRYGASAILSARMIDPTSATTLRWQFVFDGTSQEIDGATDEGPHLAADVLGRYYAVADKESTTVTMEVSGIDGIDAYGTTLTYLSGLSMVRTVKIEALQRDVLRLHLELRGNVENLQRSLEFDQKLSTQTNMADASGTLVYHLSGKDKH